MDSVVFTSIIKYQGYFSGKFLMCLLVCQAFILNPGACEKMLEASGDGGMVKGKCGVIVITVR